MHFLLSILLSAFTVVIDAGHGGKDPGAVGRISQEKDLNLDVALRLGTMISNNYRPEDVRVVYTRSTDEFISLQGRADIVNRNNADLFICIHTNSAENRSVRGAETFVLGTEKMEKNLDVAMRENSVIKLEKDYKATYQGFDPNSIDSYIMFELMQNHYMDQSLRYATMVQRHFSDTLCRADRGVRQAAFWVLLKSACPSVLVEMGFISNAEEEQYLVSEQGKQQMTEALFRSFVSFCRKPQKSEEVSKSIPHLSDSVRVDTVLSNTPEELPVIRSGYAVQILASRKPLLPSDPQLKGEACSSFEKGGFHKYYVGPYADRSEAVAMLKRLRVLFPDCFIIKL